MIWLLLIPMMSLDFLIAETHCSEESKRSYRCKYGIQTLRDLTVATRTFGRNR